MTILVQSEKFGPDKGIEGSGIPYNFEPRSWNLSDIPISSVADGIKALNSQTEAFAALRKELSQDSTSTQEFLVGLAEFQKLSLAHYRFREFLRLKFSEDTSNEEFRSDRPANSQALQAAATEIAHFKAWFRGCSQETANTFIEGAPEELRYYLSHLHKLDPNVLGSNEIARIESLAVHARSLSEDYGAAVGSLSFEVPWSNRRLSASELGGYRYSPAMDRRDLAYKLSFEGHAALEELIWPCFVGVVNNWDEQSRVLRGYQRPTTYINERVEGLNDRIIDNLLTVCRENEDILREFVELKARALGVSRLSRFDLYTSIGSSADPIPYAEGIKIVLDAFYRFDPEWAKMASELLQKGHVNSHSAGNREPGAYCDSYGPGILPYLFINYDGSLNCLLGWVAHEFGHAIHFTLANGQPALVQDTGTLMCEVASTLAEKVTFDYLLERFPERRLELLNAELVGVYQTIFRQAFFGRFEEQAHRLVLGGANSKEVCDSYLDGLRHQFGSRIDVDASFRFECFGVKHFYGAVDHPFYCPSYAGADLSSLQVFARCKSEGDPFVERVNRMLSRGGSISQLALAAECGIDLTSGNFADQAFAHIRERLQQFRSEVERL